MTTEEIKDHTSMIDVLNRYGIQPNKAGFIRCPFHAEHTASCKIYPDSFYCFGCHASGDIFTFIQKMENCGFKRAYEILGGTYDGKGVSDVALLHIAKRRSQVRETDRKKKLLLREYIKACEKLQTARKAICYAPKESEIFVDSIKHISQYEYRVSCLDEQLTEIERR
jgi:DNA primase